LKSKRSNKKVLIKRLAMKTKKRRKRRRRRKLSRQRELKTQL